MSDPRLDEVIASLRAEFSSLRQLAERAVAQIDDEAFFRRLDEEANAVAHLMKHVGGNLRSRWTDPFTSDGEKPDRRRDLEFEDAADNRAGVQRKWDLGWAALDRTLEALTVDDLARTIVIRGEPHPLPRALTRSLAHTAGHVHQMLLLCKHWQGTSWQTLSLPRRRDRGDAGGDVPPAA